LYLGDVKNLEAAKSVDCALSQSGDPDDLSQYRIGIECKPYGFSLEDWFEQISGYYQNSRSPFEVIALTDGRNWWFFTSTSDVNVLDPNPFFKIDLLKATNAELQSFAKLGRGGSVEKFVQEHLPEKRVSRRVEILVEKKKLPYREIEIPDQFASILEEAPEYTSQILNDLVNRRPPTIHSVRTASLGEIVRRGAYGKAEARTDNRNWSLGMGYLAISQTTPTVRYGDIIGCEFTYPLYEYWYLKYRHLEKETNSEKLTSTKRSCQVQIRIGLQILLERVEEFEGFIPNLPNAVLYWSLRIQRLIDIPKDYWHASRYSGNRIRIRRGKKFSTVSRKKKSVVPIFNGIGFCESCKTVNPPSPIVLDDFCIFCDDACQSDWYERFFATRTPVDLSDLGGPNPEE
jgi:hypothetical protein